MEFRILGPLEVTDGPRTFDLPGGRARSLLALLVLRVGEAVSPDRLVDELWGDQPPPTVNTVLQGFVSRLRRLLEPRRSPGEAAMVLQTVAGGYRLAVDPDDVDAHRFSRLLDDARQTSGVERARLLDAALGLWRGPALADFTFEPFAQRPITALEEMRAAAIEDRIDAALELGRHGDLVAEIERQVAAHPFRERLRGQLMLALYRAGRQRDALAAYSDARHMLMEELGIEPGPALRGLEQAVLRQDPSLELAPTAPTIPQRRVGGAAGWLPRERRTVTVLVADVATSRDRGVDPEAVDRAARRRLETAASVLRRHGARVVPAAGVALLGCFGVPSAHEDDALRSIAAALELRRAVAEPPGNGAPTSATGASMRIGIDSGEVVLGPGRDVSGPLVAGAIRLHEAAADDAILVGEATRRLVRGRVVLVPAGDIDGRRAWRVRGEVAEPIARAPAHAPLRGRARELEALRTAFRRAVRSGRPVRVTVVGEAGIGKSRLAAQLAHSIGSAAVVVTGRCPPYGEGVTFLPLRQVLLEAAGGEGWPALAQLLDADDAAQVGGALGMAPAAGVDRLFPALGRLFEQLAAARPLVVVFDDLHWAEPTLLDVMDYLATTVAGPVFLLGLRRPEPAPPPPVPSEQLLALQPLDAADVAELVRDRTRVEIPADEVSQIVSTASGNPLFAEQLLAARADSGLDAVPGSLQGLLTARLDSVGPGERDLIRCAAVIGPEGGDDALTALLPEDALPFLDRHLDVLADRQFVERSGGAAWSFRHFLIQRAAYQSMTREDRADLHERYAGWLEANRSTLPELDEIVGHHLEQALNHRRTIGFDEAALTALGRRAGERLARAAEGALGRFDLSAAEGLLIRARGLLPAEHPRRSWVTQRLSETSLVMGRHRQGQRLLDELIDDAHAGGDRSGERFARLERARIQLVADPTPLAAIRSEAESGLAFFERDGNEAGRSSALFLLGCVEQLEGNIVAAVNTFRTGLDQADRSGEAREVLAYRWMLAETLALGPTTVADCVASLAPWILVHGLDHPGVLTELAMLHAMEERFSEGPDPDRPGPTRDRRDDPGGAAAALGGSCQRSDRHAGKRLRRGRAGVPGRAGPHPGARRAGADGPSGSWTRPRLAPAGATRRGGGHGDAKPVRRPGGRGRGRGPRPGRGRPGCVRRR